MNTIGERNLANFTVREEMVTKLGLRGNTLFVYAIISEYSPLISTNAEIAHSLRITKNRAGQIINGLVSKNLIAIENIPETFLKEYKII